MSTDVNSTFLHNVDKVSILSFGNNQFNSGTYKSCHAFTATIELGAKVPDRLATCNFMESESIVRSKVKLEESDKEFTGKR